MWTNNLSVSSKNIKLILNYVVGPSVFCILLYSIHLQLQRQTDWETSLRKLRHAMEVASPGKLFLIGILMFVNWGLEARKWQIILAPVQRISFFTSYKAIFSGATLAFFTPNRTGEYIGRMLHLRQENRASSIAVTVVCSIAQLTVTLFAGIGGLLFLKYFAFNSSLSGVENTFWLSVLLYAVIAGTIILTIFYFRLSWVVRWVKKIPKIEKYITYIQVLGGFNATILLRILSLSIIRYLVFAAQYYWLFQVFEVELSWWQSFWSVSVVFLVLAIVPSMAILSELGIRWKASMEIASLFSPNVAGILAVSLSVWILNLVIPALIGSLLLLGLKIFRREA